MKLTIRGKIIVISVTIMFFAMGATILINSLVFAKEYSIALRLKAVVIAQTLKFQLDRLMKLKIPISELIGFDEQCRDVLTKYEEIAYAMVVDIDGTILFHNDPSKHGEGLGDPALFEDIKNQQEIFRKYSTAGKQFYSFTVPVFGLHGEHVAAVVLGFRAEYIVKKTREIMIYSVEVALFFIGLAILLLILLLNLWVSKPLNRLIAVIHEIREKGTSSTRLVDVHSEDEIGHLSFAFNQMMSELEDSHRKVKNYAQELEEKVRDRTAELKATNEQLEKDVAARERAQDALNQAYQELKTTQAQLIQSGKLASIGELASGVAHELNQPLMVIRTTAQFIQRILRNGGLKEDQLKNLLEKIETNTKRMMNIINHLRTFSRQSQKGFSSQDVNKIIEGSFLMIGEQLRLHNIEVRKNLLPNLPKVQGDVNQLEQVFLNLLTNARDAIAVKGLNTLGYIDIITRVSEENNLCVEILVRDNGAGISPEHLEKIFDPFFTTKEVDKGTGLGLSISYGIVKDHQGMIEIAESGPKGTTFRVKLPVE